MRFPNKLIIIMAALFLSGCINPVRPDSPTIPASMTSPCEPLEQLDGMTGKDLTNNITHNAAIHYRCVDKYNALIEAVAPKGAVPKK